MHGMFVGLRIIRKRRGRRSDGDGMCKIIDFSEEIADVRLQSEIIQTFSILL